MRFASAVRSTLSAKADVSICSVASTFMTGAGVGKGVGAGVGKGVGAGESGAGESVGVTAVEADGDGESVGRCVVVVVDSLVVG